MIITLRADVPKFSLVRTTSVTSGNTLANLHRLWTGPGATDPSTLYGLCRGEPDGKTKCPSGTILLRP